VDVARQNFAKASLGYQVASELDWNEMIPGEDFASEETDPVKVFSYNKS
jgi:hypothetical protein